MADSLKKGIGVKFLLPIVTLYAAVAGFLGVDNLTLSQAALQRVGIAGASGVGLLVLGDLLPRSVKEVLVFWRLRHRPPGFRAFTAIAPRDGRIDPTELAVLLPTSTMGPTEQNALWYRCSRRRRTTLPSPTRTGASSRCGNARYSFSCS